MDTGRSGFLRCSGWGSLVTGDGKEGSQLQATMVAIPFEGLAVCWPCDWYYPSYSHQNSKKQL